MVDVIDLDLIDNLLRVGKCFGDVAEDFSHFIGCFQPFLLGIVHSVDIVDEMVCTQANESVVGFGIFLVDEMGVVGSDHFDVVLASEFKKNRVDLFLALIDILVASGFLGLMALDLDVVVFSEEGLEPLNGFFCFRKIPTFGDSIEDFLGQLATKTGRAADDTLVPFFQKLFVDTGRVVEGIGHIAMRDDAA